MKLGVRGKLFISSLLLILLVVTISGIVAHRFLQTLLMRWIETDMSRSVMAVKEAVEGASDLDVVTADGIADRMSHALGMRVTIVDADGRVLGDSDLTLPEVHTAANHRTRAEIRDAMSKGTGTSQRYSPTAESELLYSAIRYEHPTAGPGVARVARPLSPMTEALVRLRYLLLLAGLVGLGIAVMLNALAAHYMAGAVRGLVENARRITQGESSRINITSRDELQVLAGSFNQMADELERTMAALADERNRFETVLEGMSEGIIAIDESGRIELVNPTATRWLSLKKDVIGEPFLAAVRNPDFAAVARKGSRERSSGEFEVGRDPRRRLLATSTPLRGGGGAVIVLHDVTDIRRLEKVRQDFIANASHELRTPISVVRANAETLLEGALDDPEQAQKFVAGLHRNAERLSQIVSDLLDLSRIEEGVRTFEPEEVTLSDAVRSAVATLEGSASEKSIELSVSIPKGLTVKVDPFALDQVLINLLDNAIKYTPEAGHVRVEASREGDRARLAVVDDGPGIDPVHRSRIFERFYRIDTGRSRAMGGTGLGLSIVRHLVEGWGGQVGIEGAEPQGSIFWLEMPVATTRRDSKKSADSAA